MVLAAAEPDPGGGGLVQYGVLGIVSAASMSALWWMVKKTDARADRLEAENRELNKQIQKDVIPVLALATERLAKIAENAERRENRT